MSDDYHRPTYTTRDPHGAFNPTQVRLYGLQGLPRTTEEDAPWGGGEEPAETTLQAGYAPRAGDWSRRKTSPAPPEIVTGVYKDELAVIGARLRAESDSEDDFLAFLQANFSKYFTKVPSSYVFLDTKMRDYMVMLGGMDINPGNPKPEMSSGVIFGYAFEGHAYDFPKPKIMLIPARPQAIFPTDDSGYYAKSREGYAVWIVDKLDQCIEFEVNQGFVEQLVLEANLPGKRSPSMYAGRMRMGHSGGRLTD
ncbi:MAG: hypothetical protein JNL61_08295 [Rhizobiaceae bacterium]|nr:hypothetical protein [Rhizobiaceae bacterium]